MTALVIAPELGKSLIQERGIVTVPFEDATVACSCVKGENCVGLIVNELPVKDRTLQRHLLEMGDRFVSRMRARGKEWTGAMALHGPWYSYEFSKTAADVDSTVWNEAQRGDGENAEAWKTLCFVHEKPAEQGGYMDYVLLAEFLAPNVLTEIIVNEEE